MWSFFWYVFPASWRLFGRHRSGDFDPGRKTILDVSPPGDPHLGYLHPNRCERQRRPAILPRVLHIHPLVLIDLGKTAGSKDVLTVIVAYTALPCVGFLVYDFPLLLVPPDPAQQ